MDKKEVIQVLATIESVYPQFKISDETVLMWLRVMKEMDCKLVMQKLTAHIARHPFPPVLAEGCEWSVAYLYFCTEGGGPVLGEV